MNILGLLLNLVGVVLLFCVGMPFQIPADTKIGRWSTSSLSFRLKSPDDFYTILGIIELSALILGTLLQILATLSRRK
jgi:hypothetical protein